MHIEIEEQLCKHIQSLTAVSLNARDYEYFVDWLVLVGVGTVKAALREHPELSLGDLVMMQYRWKNH